MEVHINEYVVQSDVENGESSPPEAAVSLSPSVAPLNPEVILREEEEVNIESEAAAARKAFNASLQDGDRRMARYLQNLAEGDTLQQNASEQDLC